MCGCPADAAPAEKPKPREAMKPGSRRDAPAKRPGRGRPPSTPRKPEVPKIPGAQPQVNEIEVAAQVLSILDALAAKNDFAEYCRQAWPVIEPSTQLDWNWHHELICKVVQGMVEEWAVAQNDKSFIQKVLNALFNVPPGSLKSRLLAVFLPTWCWIRWPGMKFICLSVNEAASLRDGRASRDLIRSEWYQKSFQPAWKIKDDQDAISNYGNTAGGERLSRASGSEIVGLRADLLIIDDPNNPLESESKVERDKVNDLWTTNQHNRVNDPLRSMRIGVQQRTHAADWTGYVLSRDGEWSLDSRDGWLHVCLPAEFEASRKCITPWGMDPRKFEGESIHAVRMPPEWLKKERARLRDKYAGLMQQRPVLLEGGRLKRAAWNFCRLDKGIKPMFDNLTLNRPRPAGCVEGDPKLSVGAKHYSPNNWDLDWVCISLDCAAKKTERGSQWGMIVVAGKEGRRLILDDRTRRGDILEILQQLKDLIRLWHPDKILIELAAAGEEFQRMIMAQMAQGDLPMVVVEMVPTKNRGKEERLDACLPTIHNGFVYLLDGAEWLEDFVDECALFPNAVNDDRVDALSMALNHYMMQEEAYSLPDANAWSSVFSG